MAEPLARTPTAAEAAAPGATVRVPVERLAYLQRVEEAAEAEGWVALTAPEARVCAEAVRLAWDVARKNATDPHKSDEEQARWRHRELALWALIGRLGGRR